MPNRDTIVIAASAGGLEALRHIAANLPSDLAASLFIVLHIDASTSVLPKLLTHADGMPAIHPTDAQQIENSFIYIAPPDQHMTIHDGSIRVERTAKENGFRPAADPLFRSAAQSRGPRVIGVVLTGALDDGAAGLASVKQCGGIAIVQDPEDAAYRSMPDSALETTPVDYVLPLAHIPAMLLEEVGRELTEAEASRTCGQPLKEDEKVAEDLAMIEQRKDTDVALSGLSCPSCGGALWEIYEGHTRFKCRTGHAYSPESLLREHGNGLETALWSAVRALDERASISRRMASRARDVGHHAQADKYEERADEANKNSAALRRIIAADPGAPCPETTEA